MGKMHSKIPLASRYGKDKRRVKESIKALFYCFGCVLGD